MEFSNAYKDLHCHFHSANTQWALRASHLNRRAWRTLRAGAQIIAKKQKADVCGSQRKLRETGSLFLRFGGGYNALSNTTGEAE